MKCPKCQTEIPFEAGAKLGRRDQCSQCTQDLRVCILCEFYDPSSQWECKEHISEQVMEKEKSNFCDYFRLSGKERHQAEQSQTHLSAAEALFKKK